MTSNEQRRDSKSMWGLGVWVGGNDIITQIMHNKPPVNVSKSLMQQGQLTVTCTGVEKGVSNAPPTPKKRL